MTRTAIGPMRRIGEPFIEAIDDATTIAACFVRFDAWASAFAAPHPASTLAQHG
jgi:hypothetical protein